jgi:hypothetical protein
VPPRRRQHNPTRRRWVVAERDISEHIDGSPPARIVLIYEPAADRIISAGVEQDVNAAVAAAISQIEAPGRGPRVLACDQRVIGPVRLNTARFTTTPDIVAAAETELRAMNALFDDFLSRGPAAPAHRRAMTALEGAARRFIVSECWRVRADSQPLLLDASINGERAGGLVSVMGNGGETFGVSVFPSGDAFNAVLDGARERVPPEGVLSCVLDPRALRDPTIPAVEMAVSIRSGEAEPPRGSEVHLLHVALIAAADGPAVGQAEPVTGDVAGLDFQASYVVFDMEGAEEATRKAKAPAASRRHVRRSAQLQFGVLPRSVADAVVSPHDELPAMLLAALPKKRDIPAVFVGYETASEAAALVDTVQSGDYLGVSAEQTPIGTTLRLIGRSDPVVLGVVGTNWPPLRGFMRRREEFRGLHLLVVASKERDDLAGMFVCVLPQKASTAEGPRPDTGLSRARSRQKTTRPQRRRG